MICVYLLRCLSFSFVVAMEEPSVVDIAANKRYFLYCLRQLPAPYTSLDTNRLTLAYFCVAGLDLMGGLEEIDDVPGLIAWIYSQQVLCQTSASPARSDAGAESPAGGFRAHAMFGGPFRAEGLPPANSFDSGHIALTYCALAILCILGDDLRGVDRDATLRHVRKLQDAHGCFRSVDGGESDMRFVYCAAAICAILKDGALRGEDLGEREAALGWVGMDAAEATRYIISSQTYEGALGMGPGTEAHGGSTYTGVAALSLMGMLHALPRRADALRWCVERQVGGFQGRPNKDEDTCYSFWIGASMHMLGADALVDAEQLGAFAQRCQFPKGGLSKTPHGMPDVLHSYLALAGLSLARAHPKLAPLDPRLGMTQRACDAAGLRRPTAVAR